MQSNASVRVLPESPHVQEVNATAGGLVKATLGSAIVAAAILVFVWLPAEYGIDPTGVGHRLGLTEMGRIKEQLHAEADAAAVQATQVDVVEINALEIALKLDAIQSQLSAIAASLDANSSTPVTQTTTQTTVQDTDKPAPAPVESTTSWSDAVDYTLAPGEGIEVKLVMDEGAIADYEWSANGAVVNHDTHGDGSGQTISYEQGRSVPDKAGQLTAAFAGNHGWFWRNRTDDDVLVSLRTRGDYKGMVLP